MNVDPKILAQLDIPAAAETVLLTAPSDGKARVQGFTFANRNNAANSFRLSFSKLGAATALKDYVYYDLPMTANNVFLTELDFTMDGTDVCRVYSTNGGITVTLYGKLT